MRSEPVGWCEANSARSSFPIKGDDVEKDWRHIGFDAAETQDWWSGQERFRLARKFSIPPSQGSFLIASLSLKLSSTWRPACYPVTDRLMELHFLKTASKCHGTCEPMLYAVCRKPEEQSCELTRCRKSLVPQVSSGYYPLL